jgi:hypothetical protein
MLLQISIPNFPSEDCLMHQPFESATVMTVVQLLPRDPLTRRADHPTGPVGQYIDDSPGPQTLGALTHARPVNGC